jgi:RNA polymerase sigma-70 factor (ECF subfamily)
MTKDLPIEVQKDIIEEFPQNPEVFSQVYEFYYEPILKYLVKRTMSSEAAYDITSDTFLKAYNTFHKFKWRGISIKVWVYRIATNALKDHYRSKPKQLVLVENMDENPHLVTTMNEELEAMDKALFGDEELSKLHAAIEKLSPKYQNLIGLYYFTGLSQREIAQTIKRSESAVKAMMHRAMTQLKSEMNN